MAVLWPWSVISPLNPIRAAFYFDKFFEKPWREIYEGVLYAVPDMPATYLPHLFMLKLPMLMLALGLGGAIGALLAATRSDVAPPRRAGLLMLVLASFLPIVVAMITRPALYNGLRHFIFLTPTFAVLGGIAAAWAIERARTHGRIALVGLVALFAAGIAVPVVGMVRLHPYEYVYFNPLIGGVRGAEGKYMLDYWGLAFKQAAGRIARAACRRRRPSAQGQALGGGYLRAAGLGRRRTRTGVRNDLRSENGRLRHGARHVLLHGSATDDHRRNTPRRRGVRARLRSARRADAEIADAARRRKTGGRQRTSDGRFGSNFQLGIRNCMATASSRAPAAMPV